MRTLTVRCCLLAWLALLWACKSEGPRAEPPRSASIYREGGILNSAEVEHLVNQLALAGTRRINLVNTRIGDEGVAAIARSPHLGDVKSLTLFGTGMTNVGLGALSTAQALRPEVMAFGFDGFDHRGLRLLFRSPVAAELRELTLSGHLGGDSTAKALVTSGAADSLARLYFSVRDTGDAGVHTLITSRRLATLRYLSLDGCWCPTALLPLTNPRHLPGLRELAVTGYTIDLEVRRALETARPGLRISDPTRKTGGPDRRGIVPRTCLNRDGEVTPAGDCPAARPSSPAPAPGSPAGAAP